MHLKRLTRNVEIYEIYSVFLNNLNQTLLSILYKKLAIQSLPFKMHTILWH